MRRRMIGVAGDEAFKPVFDLGDIAWFLQRHGVAGPGFGKLTFDQLNYVQDKMRPGVALGRRSRVTRPDERVLCCAVPISLQQGRFTSGLVHAHGSRRHYLVRVSSMSGEVACTCMPSAG